MNRTQTRLSSDLTVNFLYNNTIYSGTVISHSRCDMFIKLDIPCQLMSKQKKFEIRIPVKDRVLLAMARITRVDTYGKDLHGIGVELEYPLDIESLLDN